MHRISMNSLFEIGLLSLRKYIIQRQGRGQFLFIYYLTELYFR